jgi:hypothetical protein
MKGYSIKKIVLGSIMSIMLIHNADANKFAGIVICNAIDQPFVISCNGKTPPFSIQPNRCLPASWKDMATIPGLFGGTPQNPVTHFTCQWQINGSNEIVSTVMDIMDDHSGNFPVGKVSNVVVKDNYTFKSNPNPIPDTYLSNIDAVLMNNTG